MSVATANLLYMDKKDVSNELTPLDASTLRLHELYITFVKTSFTKVEALDWIVKTINNKKDLTLANFRKWWH